MEYKSDTINDTSEITYPLEKPEIQIDHQILPLRDIDLINHLADMFTNLPDFDDPTDVLNDMLSCVNQINYNIDDMLEDINAFSSFDSILKFNTNILIKEKCLTIIMTISKYSNYPLIFFFHNAYILLDLLNNQETFYQTIDLFKQIINYNNEYTFALITKAGLLTKCCELFLQIEDSDAKLTLLNFIQFLLSKTYSSTFHFYFNDVEVIYIPLNPIKHAILHDFHLTISFSIFNIIADNWTSDFRSLFDPGFTEKCLKIWNSAFPLKEDIPLCEEIIKLLNKLIFLFPDDFIMFKLYNPIIKTLLEIAKRDESYPHLKILFLCSNIAARPESGTSLIESGLFSLYEERYDLMTAKMKENFLFTFGNLILNNVIKFDDNEKTIYYFTEMLDIGTSKCSNSFQNLVLKILDIFREEIIQYIDPNDVSEFIDTMNEKESQMEETLSKIAELNSFYFDEE